MSQTRSARNLQKNRSQKSSSSTPLHPIVLYVLESCPYCHRAMELLDGEGLKYNKIIVSSDEKEKIAIKKKTGMKSFPMIFVQDAEDHKVYHRLGGCDDLVAHLQTIADLRAGRLHMEALHALLEMTKSLKEN